MDRLLPILDKINKLEQTVSQMSKEDIRAKILFFKELIHNKQKTLDELLPEVFALTREASRRTINKRHFDTQILGGIVIHQGMIAEMKTGEGKTLVASLPAVLNSLTGKPVYVITVNDYLAKRDSELLRPIYEYLGLTVSYIVPDCNHNKKQQNYRSDIVYITNNEVCFDYLRDNMAKSMGQKLQRGSYFAIIDEIDNILIDEARTPLIISGPDNENSDLYNIINPSMSLLNENDYEVEAKSKNVTLKNTGFDKIEQFLTQKGLINNDLFSENIGIYHIVSNLVKAHFGMFDNKDYIVYKDEVIIIDEFTGRLAHGRKFSNGLHQALEAKEGVTVKQGSKTNAFISYTNYFKLFDKIGGMTGTASSEADEFNEMYDLKVVKINTYKPLIRKDDEKIKLYQKKSDMYIDAIEIIKEKHQKGQPLLLCTPSVYDSEELSYYLDQQQIKHKVLNAKNHEKEAAIVAQAGQLGQITIATSMAGRGTDIILGGCVESAIKDMLQTNPDINVEIHEEELSSKFAKNRVKVLEAGGLCVIILGALESDKSRIQFIGRAGRQGDPGESIVMASLEDDLLLPLFKDTLNRFFISLYFPDKVNVSNRVQSTIKDIQNMYQSHYFEIRKNILKYDDIINLQRKEVYDFRDYLMTTNEIKHFVEKILLDYVDEYYDSLEKKDYALDKLKIKFEGLDFNSLEDLKFKLTTKLLKNLENIDNSEVSSSALNYFDEEWFELINELENLKKTIYLVSYEQKDPVFEFRTAAFNLFIDMMSRFKEKLYRHFILNESSNIFGGFGNFGGEGLDMSNLFSGLNDMQCFCGSEKPFMECHGASMGNELNFNDDDDDEEEDDDEDIIEGEEENEDVKQPNMEELLSSLNEIFGQEKNGETNQGTDNDLFKSLNNMLNQKNKKNDEDNDEKNNEKKE